MVFPNIRRIVLLAADILHMAVDRVQSISAYKVPAGAPFLPDSGPG